MDELLAYLAENDAVVDPSAVREHLADCAKCLAGLREAEQDFEVLNSRAFWDALADYQPPSSSRKGRAAVLATKERLDQEAAEAERTFETLSGTPVETWIDRLLDDGLHRCTDALVRRLIQEARNVEQRAPKQSLRVLEVADTISGLVPPGDLGADTLGDLSKARANTLMTLGDYRGALVAWDRAETAYARSLVSQFDLALVEWGRASVYFQMGEYSLALPLVRTAKRTLRRFGDTARVTQLKVLEGGILYEQGDIAAAERTFERLMPILMEFGDEITLGRVLANIACCRLRQDDFDSAIAHAGRAIEIYSRYGLETEIIRIRWALAKIQLQTGMGEEAEIALERIAAEFEQLGLGTDAAQIRLDIVEDLIRREEYARAAILCRSLINTFIRADSHLSIVQALAHLREATDGERTTVGLVYAVRHVLLHPDQPFSPPN